MKITLFLILFFVPLLLFSQKTIPTIGGGVGIGSMVGNFPSQTTFGGKIFFETVSPLTLFDRIQYNVTFAQKIEKFLPGSYDYSYYSYFTSIGIAGMFNQKLTNKYFIEEGIGIIYLNDRSFNDINSWNWGILINLIGGLALSNELELTLNIDYGVTLNKTNAAFILFLLGVSYNI